MKRQGRMKELWASEDQKEKGLSRTNPGSGRQCEHTECRAVQGSYRVVAWQGKEGYCQPLGF